MPTKPPNRYPTLGQTVAESVLLHRPELTEAKWRLIRRMQKRNYRPTKKDLKRARARR